MAETETVQISDEEEEEFVDAQEWQWESSVEVEEYLRGLGVRPRREWLQGCMMSMRYREMGVAQQAEECLSHFLFADMNTAGDAILPPNIHTLHSTDIPGPFLLQVDEVVNLSSPLRDRYKETPAGTKRCLKLSMTDGVQRVFGIEYRPIKDLMVLLPAGMKIALRNVHVRRGLLMLVPEVVDVLGGVVEHLEAARERLFQEVNKPPRGRRSGRGEEVLSLASRALAAAWPPDSSNIIPETNDAVSIESALAQSTSPEVTVIDTDSETCQRIPIEMLPTSGSNLNYRCNEAAGMTMDLDRLDLIDEGFDCQLLESEESEIPFTYLACLKARKQLEPVVQGRVKCILTGVKEFQFKERDKFELFVYVDDGSLISEVLVDHQVVQSIIGTGGWKASLFIIGVEVAERMSYYSISSSLITYLTVDLHQSTATAAKNVNIWSGVTSILPFLGAFLADAYWGRYWTTLISSIIYLLGLISLTASVSLPFLKPPPCDPTAISCSKATPYQIGVFFCSLYLIAVGTGGHKPCIEAFGADQFDEDPEENKHKSSFFNWWYFGQCSGALIALTIVLYIEENIGWEVGFAIPTVAMALALFVFLYGSKFYRHKLPPGNLLACAAKTVSECFVGRRMNSLHLDHLKSPDRAVLEDNQGGKLTSNCVATQAEEFKIIPRLIPIWVTCLMYGVVFAQSSTFFTKQGSTMDRKISGHFQIPPASLQCLIAFSILVLVPVYDWILVPLARKFTGHERGITLLQRIGFGMFFSMVAMVVAALIEIRRLKEVKDNGLVDMPDAIVPMTILWLLPQYILYGISEIFAMVGMQEYFYDQMPEAMRSLGIAVFLSVFGIGSFLSSIIISIVDELSSISKEGSWFSDNLNKAHLDYYYWLLSALSAINLCIYICFANRYNNKKIETSVFDGKDMLA